MVQGILPFTSTVEALNSHKFSGSACKIYQDNQLCFIFRLEAAVAATEGRVDLAVVDIDEHSDLALDHGVEAVPTVVAVKNGEIVDKFVGLMDEDQLGAFVEKAQ